MPSNKALALIFFHVVATILLVIGFFIVVPVLLNTEVTLVVIFGVILIVAFALAQIALIRNALKAFAKHNTQG